MEKNIENINVVILNFIVNIFPDFSDNNTIVYTKVVIPKEQAWSTYKIRYDIKAGKQTLSIESKELYESTLEKLQGFNEEDVSIHLFNHSNRKMAIIFSDITDSKIIGHILLP